MVSELTKKDQRIWCCRDSSEDDLIAWCVRNEDESYCLDAPKSLELESMVTIHA